MVDDKRESRKPDHGSEVWASGDSGTSKDILETGGGEVVSINDYLVTYDNSGTTSATVELYDDTAGTSQGNLGTPFETLEIHPSDDPISVVGISRHDIEDTVIGVVSNNDSNVTVTVGGFGVTG